VSKFIPLPHTAEQIEKASFKSWEECAKWFEKLIHDFNESDQATISDQMAMNILLRALTVLQFRLNATVNQEVCEKRTKKCVEDLAEGFTNWIDDTSDPE